MDTTTKPTSTSRWSRFNPIRRVKSLASRATSDFRSRTFRTTNTAASTALSGFLDASKKRDKEAREEAERLRAEYERRPAYLKKLPRSTTGRGSAMEARDPMTGRSNWANGPLTASNNCKAILTEKELKEPHSYSDKITRTWIDPVNGEELKYGLFTRNHIPHFDKTQNPYVPTDYSAAQVKPQEEWNYDKVAFGWTTTVPRQSTAGPTRHTITTGIDLSVYDDDKLVPQPAYPSNLSKYVQGMLDAKSGQEAYDTTQASRKKEYEQRWTRITRTDKGADFKPAPVKFVYDTLDTGQTMAAVVEGLNWASEVRTTLNMTHADYKDTFDAIDNARKLMDKPCTQEREQEVQQWLHRAWGNFINEIQYQEHPRAEIQTMKEVATYMGIASNTLHQQGGWDYLSNFFDTTKRNINKGVSWLSGGTTGASTAEDTDTDNRPMYTNPPVPGAFPEDDDEDEEFYDSEEEVEEQKEGLRPVGYTRDGHPLFHHLLPPRDWNRDPSVGVTWEGRQPYHTHQTPPPRDTYSGYTQETRNPGGASPIPSSLRPGRTDTAFATEPDPTNTSASPTGISVSYIDPRVRGPHVPPSTRSAVPLRSGMKNTNTNTNTSANPNTRTNTNGFTRDRGRSMLPTDVDLYRPGETLYPGGGMPPLSDGARGPTTGGSTDGVDDRSYVPGQRPYTPQPTILPSRSEQPTYSSAPSDYPSTSRRSTSNRTEANGTGWTAQTGGTTQNTNTSGISSRPSRFGLFGRPTRPATTGTSAATTNPLSLRTMKNNTVLDLSVKEMITEHEMDVKAAEERRANPEAMLQSMKMGTRARLSRDSTGATASTAASGGTGSVGTDGNSVWGMKSLRTDEVNRRWAAQMESEGGSSQWHSQPNRKGKNVATTEQVTYI